jgi:hypothetical protein
MSSAAHIIPYYCRVTSKTILICYQNKELEFTIHEKMRLLDVYEEIKSTFKLQNCNVKLIAFDNQYINKIEDIQDKYSYTIILF